MSSTLSSSSVCSWDERNGNSLVNDGGITKPRSTTTYCTALTHPLVYYAELPPYHQKSQSHQRKAKKNCFAKAFKWYVQERHSKPTGDISPELSGFAAWLDSKYFEYVEESKAKPQQQTSTDVCPPCSYKTEPTKRRKFSRSPWRKRKQQNKIEDETRNTCKTPMGSCQIILQPKDLTRPVSECYHVAPETVATDSKVTVTSIELKNSQRTVVKSLSTASVNHEQVQCSNKGYENTKAPLSNTPCDPNCANSPNLINLQIQKALEKTQKAKSICDEFTSCLSNPNSKVKGETHIRDPTITQKVENVDSCTKKNSEQRTQKKPTEALKAGIFCDPIYRYNTEFNNMQDMRSVPAQVLNKGSSCGPIVPKFETGGTPSTKAQKVACDPSYIPKHKHVDNRKMTKQKRETVDSCSCKNISAAVTEKILYGPNYTYNSETRSVLERTQKVDGFCNPNCKYITKGKAEVELQNVSVKTRTVDLSCEPSCTYMPGNKAEKQVNPAKTQKADLSCDPSCTYIPGHKNEKQITPAKTQKEDRSCIPDSLYTAQKSFVKIQSHPTEIQKTKDLCDPSCTNNKQQIQEIKTVDAKSQNKNSCDPNCTFAPKYKTGAEIQRTISKTQKMQVNCAPTCTYKPGDESFVDSTASKYKEVHRPGTKMTEAAWYSSCEYNAKQEIEEKQVPEAKPPKTTIPYEPIPPKMDIPCKPISLEECSKTKITIDKIDNMENQCSNYKSIPVTDGECYSQTTGTLSKYVLVPENTILPINAEALCECCNQVSTKSTSVPYKCVIVKKLPSVPLQVLPCKTPNRSVSSSWGSKIVAKTADVSCQYSLDDIIVKLDAPSQYEQSNLSYYNDPLCACSKPGKPRPIYSEQRTESCITKKTANPRMRSLSLYRTNAVQTSDHSINFNNEKGPNYAFFMKIVCADKLNDCFCDEDL